MPGHAAGTTGLPARSSALGAFMPRGDGGRADPTGEFWDALRARGFRLTGPPVMDGQPHRAAVEGDKRGEKSGLYRGWLTGALPGGFIKNFRDETRTGNWKSGAALPAMSAAKREAMWRAAV